jgi:phage major head subunit gpT-like protein
MSRKTSTPARSREAQEQVPDRIELRCQPGRITLEALAVEGEAEAIPRFTMVAYTGEPLRVEGWRFPVVVDLEGLSIPSQRRPVRFGHSMYAGVGHTERIAVEAGRLIAEGIVSRDTGAAREVVASGKRGFPWQASIGAQVAQAEFVRAGKSVTVNSRTFEGPLYVARRTVLGEISFVDLGADGNTTATIAAQQQESELMDESKDKEVLDNGAPEAPQDDVARDEATGAGTEAGPAASATPAPAVNPVADIRAQALAETKRIAAIRSILGGRLPEIEARAIAEGWTPDRTELEKLRVTRPKAPAVHVTETAVTGQVLEAACMQAARVEKLERYFEAPVLDEADRQFDGRLGLAELIVEAARANGYVGRERRVTPEMLRYAFGREIRAAASTIDIGGILSNVVNKFLLEGFFSVERTWRNICAVRNVSDFKTVTSYRLIGKDQYEQVAPGGELKHGTLGEQAYTNKADTYGLLLAIDRRDIINDDLGAITTVPRKLGRGSGLKINDIFWSIFMNNAAFFSSGNSNYLTGADTALSIEGMSKAEKAFLDQTDPDGKPLGAMPAVVLVPTALSAMATVLYKSLEVRDTTASTKYPIANPHTGKFRAEVSRYLSNTQYTGYSEKAWYLLADPIDLAVIEVAFLNGQEAPTIETADADFNVLGVQMRGYHDFGVALQERSVTRVEKVPFTWTRGQIREVA